MSTLCILSFNLLERRAGGKPCVVRDASSGFVGDGSVLRSVTALVEYFCLPVG